MLSDILTFLGAVGAAGIVVSPVWYQAWKVRKENTAQHGATGDGLAEVKTAIIGLTNEVRSLNTTVGNHIHDERIHLHV